MATTRENLEYIESQPRGTKFYCPSTAEYGLTRKKARAMARMGFDIIAEFDITLSV